MNYLKIEVTNKDLKADAIVSIFNLITFIMLYVVLEMSSFSVNEFARWWQEIKLYEIAIISALITVLNFLVEVFWVDRKNFIWSRISITMFVCTICAIIVNSYIIVAC